MLHPSRDSYLVAPDPAVKPPQTTKIARLQYSGNWGPEPGGWQRLASVLHKAGRIELDVAPVKLGAGKLDASVYKIAHLTGTTQMILPAAQQAELKKFIDAGGTLIIDSAGGSTGFSTSVEQLIPLITPAGSILAQLDPSHPSMARVPGIKMRRFEIARIGKSKEVLPRTVNINGRAAVFYSPLDLAAGLVGQPIDGIAGYDPDTAKNIMSGIIAYAAQH